MGGGGGPLDKPFELPPLVLSAASIAAPTAAPDIAVILFVCLLSLRGVVVVAAATERWERGGRSVDIKKLFQIDFR